jgi:hypothetical protein
MRIEVDARDEQDGENPVHDMEDLRRPVPGGENDQARYALDGDESAEDQEAGPEPARHGRPSKVEICPPNAQQDSE